MSLPRIPLAGVIGAPIAHSRSPILHGHWLRRYGLPGYYIPMEIAPERLESSLRSLPDLGFVGVNVTIPHKETVLLLAEQVSDRARLIGAANTLVFGANGEIHADNTDGYGFMMNLRQGAPEWQPAAAPAVVLGAGGAARAVLASLLEVGVPEIRLTNRSRDRAERLAQDFGPSVQVHDWSDADALIEGAALVVNTTSLGMLGKPELNLSLGALGPGMLVTDLVYAPLETGLLSAAKAAGCQTVDGLGMLLHQAVPGFERWFGKTPEVDAELRAAVLG